MEIRWNPPNVQRSDDVASGYILEVNKGGGWITREVNSNIHFWEFNRSTDGYPESVEWDVRVKAVNSYGLESEDWLTGVVNDDGYGTWAVGKPILSQYTVRRAITVEAKQPAISKERYSTIKYKVQIRLQGEAEWYEPDLLSNPDESEDNYKLGEDDFVEVNNYVQQMVPLKNQATAPEATIYEYRFTPFGVETGVEGLSETIAVIAQSSTAMDITAGSLDATKFNVQDLAAITGVFGSIQSDGIAKDANNFWNLAKPSSNLGYGVQGELCVGTTASVEPQTDDNPTGYKDSDSFLHFIPQAVGNIAKGLYIKLHNFIVTAIESLIKGTFKVISKATGAELFVVDEDDMTVSGRVLDKRTIETTDEKALTTSIDMSLTYGYAPRYAELKSARDYFEGGFCGAYSSWVTGYDENFLRLWRRNQGSESVVHYGSIDDLFKCRPSLLYPIFVNQWSGTVNDDKLLIGSVNTCVAVRPFSMYGLPYSK